jgi:hypothetical protein
LFIGQRSLCAWTPAFAGVTAPGAGRLACMKRIRVLFDRPGLRRDDGDGVVVVGHARV